MPSLTVSRVAAAAPDGTPVPVALGPPAIRIVAVALWMQATEQVTVATSLRFAIDCGETAVAETVASAGSSVCATAVRFATLISPRPEASSYPAIAVQQPSGWPRVAHRSLEPLVTSANTLVAVTGAASAALDEAI